MESILNTPKLVSIIVEDLYRRDLVKAWRTNKIFFGSSLPFLWEEVPLEALLCLLCDDIGEFGRRPKTKENKNIWDGKKRKMKVTKPKVSQSYSRWPLRSCPKTPSHLLGAQTEHNLGKVSVLCTVRQKHPAARPAQRS